MAGELERVREEVGSVRETAAGEVKLALEKMEVSEKKLASTLSERKNATVT